MYKMKEFLWKFFSPSGMKSFKYMTILASILIFLFEAYVLFFPVNQMLNKKPEKYIASNDYTKVFYNIDGSLNASISASGYKIEAGIMKSNDENEEIKIYTYTYEDKTVYYIFDVNYSVAKKAEEIKTKYKEKYPAEDNSKVEYSTVLIYAEMKKGTSMDDAIDKYEHYRIEKINEELNSLTFIDTYGLIEKNAYVMLFEAKKFYIEVPEGTSVFSDSAIYANTNLNNFDVSTYDNIGALSRDFIKEIGKNYAKNAGIVYLGNALIYALVFPFLLALIVWLGLKKRSDLKRFKEYYNILAISSIAPCLISFILAWFISSTSGLVYLSLMAIYGLVVLYRASTPFRQS